jgi:hypothetical protein
VYTRGAFSAATPGARQLTTLARERTATARRTRLRARQAPPCRKLAADTNVELLVNYEKRWCARVRTGVELLMRTIAHLNNACSAHSLLADAGDVRMQLAIAARMRGPPRRQARTPAEPGHATCGAMRLYA